ncbi:MAG: hypothetical protein CTY38_01050 [Methylotenera sp.]|uniref:endonuclease domain-containing protein n=1 Tax=Methylotenera sp. TaxID=2051956 RepID=UPI000D4AE1BA|nr:DUF559 domain-containing protein [Methylotenera sp.]PPC84666.1 MAG: hypothetical protein CTY38_01050 [Methylotenera sp.]
MRIKSIKELGKGGWKIAEMSPLKKSSPLPLKRAKSSKPDPQAILLAAVKAEWPEAIAEHPANIPGRKFRIDIALLEHMIAIEMDGWQWHAKHLEDFKKDRRRQNLLVNDGWRVFRFTAEDVYKDIEGCLTMIRNAIKATRMALIN